MTKVERESFTTSLYSCIIYFIELHLSTSTSPNNVAKRFNFEHFRYKTIYLRTYTRKTGVNKAAILESNHTPTSLIHHTHNIIDAQ